MHASLRLALCLLLAALPGVSFAQAQGQAQDRVVYRWVDAKGQVHFSDSPRAGAEAIRISASRGGEPRPVPMGARDGQDQAQCERQRRELEDYQRAPTLKERNAFGEERLFTAEEREKFLKIKQQELARACGEASAP